MDEYRFERLEPRHYLDLNYISESAFGINPGIKYYLQKNDTSYCGATNLGYIAYHTSGEPAAFYGVYSYPLMAEGKLIKAVQSGDTMTHKNHMGKGLFITLARKTYELAAAEGASFVFGFPNENSYPGFVKKLSWVHKENLQAYKVKVFAFPLLKLVKKVGMLKPLYFIYLKFVHFFYRLSNQSFQNSCNNYKLYVEHSNEFFNYKMTGGNYIVNIGRCKWWVKPDGFLFVGDVDQNCLKNFKRALMKLKVYAFWIGADVIMFHVSPGTPLDVQLRKIKEPVQGAAIGYLSFDNIIDPGLLKVNGADMDTF
jgi:hypothetical protein